MSREDREQLLTLTLLEDPIYNVGTFVTCIIIKPPLKPQVGMDSSVRIPRHKLSMPVNFVFPFQAMITLDIPNGHLNGFYNIVVCHGNNFYPSFNSLFGCDFFIATLNGEELKSKGQSMGLELKRTIHDRINSPDHPCLQNDTETLGIFDCLADQVETSISCKLPWSGNWSSQSRPCNSSDDLDNFSQFMYKAKTYWEKQVIQKLGCHPLCWTESYSLIQRWNIYDTFQLRSVR